MASVAVVAAVLASAACAPRSNNPGDDPAAEGVVADLNVLIEGAVSFTLTGLDERDYFFDAQITVGSETEVTDPNGALLVPTDISEGDVVEVWTDTCAESYPVQCRATAVRIDKGDS